MKIKFSTLPLSSCKQEISKRDSEIFGKWDDRASKRYQTGKWKVLVEWDDRSLAEASWTPLTYLSKQSSIWWYLLRECRYPMFNENMFPSLPISGPLPITDDEEENAATVSDEERDASISDEERDVSSSSESD